ncbi:unnamed protein product [Mytilus edulis]|uniref:Superoxide dismutase copper/zinc binding domain-containing protein n=1 Tax=Mytilus edulis TaxID=6550 RepID=A0A8S3QPM2_MYTED|nr:unnamed protein product [Mytilus edulis]
MMDLISVLLCFVYFVTEGYGLTLIAKVALNGVTGTVTFTQNGGDTTVNFNVAGLANTNTWNIRSNRMVYDRQVRCSDAVLGMNYIESTGTVSSSGTTTETITSAVLPNLNSLTGRALLMNDTTTGDRVCGTIEADEDHITGVAKLKSVVGGTIYFRQVSSSSSSATSIYANAFHLQNTATNSNETVAWGIYSGTCSSKGALYNPTSSSSSPCDQNNQGNCPIGDLSSKNSYLPVGENSEEILTSFVDINLPLSGSNSVIGKILVLKSKSGDVLVCSKIVQYTTRNAVATISRDGVVGMISFKQRSPFDTTTTFVDLSGLSNNAGGYHVHKWPVPEKWETEQKVCDANSVSGHFNPFGIDTSSDPAATVGTDDQYEVGDLSSKYGLLSGLTDKMENYTDYNLPLFGTNSVIGRSIVVHYGNGSRWVCATIEYIGTTVTGLTTFTYPVIGYIAFKQPTDIDIELADTMIYVYVDYGNNSSRSVDHKWHVHVGKVGSDALISSGRCSSVEGHYNPYSVDLTGNYNPECNPNNPLRCEVGDMSGKHGKISVRSTSGTIQRNFFTDFDLPLTGDLKILGRSVVIHAADSGGGRLSCADIHTIPNRKVIVKTGTWASESYGSVDGSFMMTRNTEGLIDGTTDVNIQLTGLASMAGGYHVHVNPVPKESPTPCSAASVGGHFNPFGVNATAGAIDGSGSDDEYEIGDLSRKYGTFLNNKLTYLRKETETMLPVRGPLSITGRSIVIHKSSAGAPRWVCGNITEDTASTGGEMFEAKATFSTGSITGYIYMTQYRYSDGGLSDTGVLVDLVNTDGSKTNGHKWHVHQKPVKYDATSGCSSPGGHYNPFMVDVNNGYDECSPLNHLRCELGDQSSKLGRYDIGSGRKFYTDMYLPLVGTYGVAGKSFVIHAANGGGPRVACADIIPVNKVTPLKMTFGDMNFDKSEMVTHLASALHTSPTNLAVSDATTNTDCMSVSVYFTGPNASSIRGELNNMMKKGDQKLGAYRESVICCSCTPVISILCLTIGLIIQRLVR